MDAKITQILDELVSEDNLSLYTGLGGEILLHSQLIDTSFFDENKMNSLIEKWFIETSTQANLFPTFCSGISGSIWLMDFLQKHDIIELDPDFFESIDELMYSRNQYFVQKGDYDFMHGALGNIFSLLPRKSNHSKIENQLEILLKNRIKYLGFEIFRYENEYDEERKGKLVISDGLSHGVPSIMAVLSKLYKNGISKDICLEVIDENYRFLQHIENKNKNITDFAFYPSIVVEDEELSYESRMAWCYGDLGIASAFYLVGENCDNNELKEKAVEIFDYYMNFEFEPRTGLVDAGICHGTSGVALIFYCIYYKTKKAKYLDAAEYWANQTLKMARHKDGLAGYKTWRGKNEKEELNSNFLEGITGIGLVLSTIYYRKDPSWAECLLLF